MAAFTTLRVFDDPTVARIVAGRLEAEGIPVQVSNEHVATLLSMHSICRVRLMVRSELGARANDIVEDITDGNFQLVPVHKRVAFLDGHQLDRQPENSGGESKIRRFAKKLVIMYIVLQFLYLVMLLLSYIE